MVPSIYDFYIGTALNLTMLKNTGVHPYTGAYESDSMATTSERMQVTTNKLFVSHEVSNDRMHGPDSGFEYLEYLYIYMYDKSQNYLGLILTSKPKIYELNDQTAYVAIGLVARDTDIFRSHNNFVKEGFSEVYEMRPVIPHYTDLSKKYAKESGQAFFRVSLEGNITVYGKDYEYIRASSLEDTLAFVINKPNADKYDLYYAASFNKTDCQIDHAKKSCQLKLTTIDAYNKVLDKYENTYDLIKLAPELSRIDMYKRMQLQVYIQGADSVTNLFGGTYWEEEVSEAIDDPNTHVSYTHQTLPTT